jgi:hypothetical protein
MRRYPGDERQAKGHYWLAASAIVIIAGLAACSSAGTDAAVDENDIDTTSSNLWGGYTLTGCSDAEAIKVHDSVGVLLKVGSSGYTAYKNCLAGAALVENKCLIGATIADYIRRDDVTKISCVQFKKDDTNAEAPVGIDGEKLKLDHDFIASNTAKRVASVIAHELMHNRGFRHVQNPAGSLKYGNTVPEQVEACVLNGQPNLWPLGGTPPAQDCNPCPPAKPYCCEMMPDTANTCRRCQTDRSMCQ